MTPPHRIALGLLAALLVTGAARAADSPLPYANNLLSKNQVEKVTGLANLQPVARDFKAGYEGDFNILRSDGVFVVSLTVQPPEYFEHWHHFHKDLSVELPGMGDGAFGRRIPDPTAEEPDPKLARKMYGPPVPPEYAAIYVRRGPVAFTISRLPFESTAPPGVSNAQLVALARLVVDNLDALSVPASPVPETPEGASSTADSETPPKQASS